MVKRLQGSALSSLPDDAPLAGAGALDAAHPRTDGVAAVADRGLVDPRLASAHEQSPPLQNY